MLKIQLCKGFVGITADGKKATVVSDREWNHVNQVPVFNVKVEPSEPYVDTVYYLQDGSRKDGWNLKQGQRIVAPYPPEKPFTRGIVYETCYRVLDTTDGSIHVADFIDFVRGVNSAEYALQIRRQGGEERGWFFWDGKGCEKVSHYRVLGPVEETPAPVIDGPGTYYVVETTYEDVSVGDPVQIEKHAQHGWNGVYRNGDYDFFFDDGTNIFGKADSFCRISKTKPAPKKRGMTRKRWEEIKTFAKSPNGKTFVMLNELVDWIQQHPIGMPFDEPEVEYEPHDIVSMAEAMRDGNGLTFGGTQRNPFRIVSAGLDEVIMEDIGNRAKPTDADARCDYDGLMKYHVWQDTGFPVARLKKNE